jgi:hypothetical protein
MVHILDSGSGYALSEKHTRIAEIIRDYNPELELAWIPPDQRTAFDRNVFAIMHNSAKGRYVVGTFTEEQMDHRIIQHLFSIDNKNHDVLSELEREEAAKKALRMKETMDELEERKDFARSLIKSKKHWYRHNGKVYS